MGAARLRNARRRQRALAAVLRDPETQGEVLEHVLDFASERFSRVALFMVRDEEAIGKYDCVLIGTDHDLFDYDSIFKHARLVVDTRGRARQQSERIFRA